MREDIEKNVKNINSKPIDKETSFEDMQKIQNQIMQIQAERENNLAQSKLAAQSDLANSQTLSQAAGVMVEGMQDPGPNTQAVLGKYGYPQTRRTQSRNSSRQVMPGGVVNINNNTINNVTTNQGGPVQGRALQFKQPSAESSRIKTWLSAAFAKQNEQAALREREYRKREWSLARASNQMAKKLVAVGKTVGEAVKPDRIGTTISSQLKSLMFLFGTTFLVKNWDKILKTADNIEKWISKVSRYFGVTENSRRINYELGSGFVQDLKRFLGGDEKGSISNSIKNVFKDLTDYLSLKLKHFFDERAEAVKQIQFPTPDSTSSIDIAKAAFEYFGKVMAAAFGGVEGLQGGLKKDIMKSGAKKSLENYENSKEGIKETSNIGGADAGALSLFKPDSNGKTQQALLPSAVDSNGNLTNKLSSSISQARDLGNNIELSKSGKMNVAATTSGYKRLYDAAVKGNATVENEFLTKNLDNDTLNKFLKSGDIGKKRYKLVLRPKTNEEFDRQDADPTAAAIRGGLEQLIDNSTPIGNVKNFGDYAVYSTTGAAIGSVLGPVGAGVGAALGAGGAYLVHIPEIAGMIDYSLAKSRRSSLNNYTFDFIESSDNRYPSFITDNNNNPIEFEFPNVSPKVIEEIVRRNFGYGKDEDVKSHIVNIDRDLTNRVQASFERNLAETNKKIDLENKKLNSGTKLSWDLGTWSRPHIKPEYDIDINKTYSEFDKLEQIREDHRAEQQHFWDNSSLGEIESRTREYYNKLVKWVKNSKLWGYYQLTEKELEEIARKMAIYENSNSPESISRQKLAMNTLISRLGLTPEQAAGLVGNFMRESRLNPSALNKDGGGEGAVGIAQWRGSRIRAYEGRLTGEDIKKGAIEYPNNPHKKRLIDSSLEEQLEYVIWELNNTHKRGLEELRNTNTVSNASEIALGRYEFSAGIEKTREAIDNQHGENFHKEVEAAGFSFAKSALSYYNSGDGDYKYNPNYDENGNPKYTLGVLNPETMPEYGTGLSSIDRSWDSKMSRAVSEYNWIPKAPYADPIKYSTAVPTVRKEELELKDALLNTGEMINLNSKAIKDLIGTLEGLAITNALSSGKGGSIVVNNNVSNQTSNYTTGSFTNRNTDE